MTGGAAGAVATYPLAALKTPIEAGLGPKSMAEWPAFAKKHLLDLNKAKNVIPLDILKKGLGLGASWAAINLIANQANKTASLRELGFEKTAKLSKALQRGLKITPHEYKTLKSGIIPDRLKPYNPYSGDLWKYVQGRAAATSYGQNSPKWGDLFKILGQNI